jgi:hypothetical protein
MTRLRRKARTKRRRGGRYYERRKIRIKTKRTKAKEKARTKTKEKRVCERRNADPKHESEDAPDDECDCTAEIFTSSL